MSRFYLKRTGMSASIQDRSTHELIGFVDMNKKKESKALISKLCKMSNEEYIQFCLNYGARLHTEKNGFAVNKDAEEWYEGAWKVTTKCTMEELGLKEKDIPEEAITSILVNQVKNGAIVKKEIEDTRPVHRKPLKKKEETKETKPQYSSEEELRKAYVKKEITLEQYKELRKQFRKPLPHKH